MNRITAGALTHLLEGVIIVVGAVTIDYTYPLLSIAHNMGFGGWQTFFTIYGIGKMMYGGYMLIEWK